MVKKLWAILAPFHRAFGWFVVLLVIYEGLQLLEGYTISLVINLYGEGVKLAIWAILLAGILVFDELFMRLDNHLDWHILSKHSYPIFEYLKTGAVGKFLSLDIPWHQRRNSGTLVGKVNQGVAKVAEILDGFSWEFVPTLIQAILSLIPLLILSPPVALVAVFSFSSFLWLTKKANDVRRPLRERRHDLYEDEWHQSIELVQSIETSTMFGQKERLIRENGNLHREIKELGLKEAKVAIFTYTRWRIRIMSVSRRLILAIWVIQLYQGTLDIASLVFVNVLTEKLFHSFWRFARLFDRTSEASEGAKRFVDLMGQEASIPDRATRDPEISTPPEIRFEDVCFSYEGEYRNGGVIHNLDLEIRPGQIVALVGPSGAGKTTIRKLVTRLVEINSGTITVGGVNIRNWPIASLQKLFSYVPQGDDVFILSGSARYNVAYPKPGATLEEVERACKLANIHDFLISLPQGYETQVGERGKRLSGGQKQRIALARAILADRPILILDEATNAIDAITEVEIQEKMRMILSGKTAIIVAHRLSTIWNLADKICVLSEGRKVEEGTHESLVANGGIYAKMVAIQTNS